VATLAACLFAFGAWYAIHVANIVQ